MNFFDLSLPAGRYFGIPVRIHFTFIIVAFNRLLMEGNNLPASLIFIVGLYTSVLLHEFGHSLAARWCDGDADQIILWPLGGLAVCRPLFNPTAHLITGAAGPFVSLVLCGLFTVLSRVVPADGSGWLVAIMDLMAAINGGLLIFNLLPVFPMDGGRILRDTLWFWMGVDRATRTAVMISKTVIILAIIAFFFELVPWLRQYDPVWLALIGVYIYFQASAEEASLEYEGLVRPFSIRERFKRGIRRRAFQKGVAEKVEQEETEGFHRCAVCGRTENSSRDLVFRIASDGREYCTEHLPGRKPG
jgi:Zn-dependent protease